MIFIEIKNSLKNNINVRGSIANRKYIIFFSLFTLIPSLLITIFSLFLFSFALEKYFDKKITTAVNNSYEIAKKYVDEKRNKIESDIILIAFDLNKISNIFHDNPKRFKNIIDTQKLIRDIDQIHLIDSKGNLILSSSNSEYVSIEKRALEMVLNDDRPLKIINAYENRSAAIIKLSGYTDTYLYVVKFLDKDISRYLTTSEEAINFYYTVENQNLGIKISFALIYIVIVALLLFLAITIAIKFSSRFFISINNLITASEQIGKGNLEAKVPELKADKEMEILNRNFNAMIDRLKSQQEKLLISERHEAWESVARKLAHEIKNPLTPIQLSIDNLRSKYLSYIKSPDKEKYEINLKTILNQIKQIENLVNEFSDFARMPKPLFRENDLINLFKTNINLLQKIDTNIKINLKLNGIKNMKLVCDNEQISRVIFNLVKNSIESIQEKSLKTKVFDKIVNIEIKTISDYIIIEIIDNGLGFSSEETKKLIKPYYTTKQKGTGLGLSIVNKIISDHNGSINFNSQENGAKVQIILPLNNVN
jgi:two-component system nitrogen regulation sensor histidine kinase NtrY|tara:strand:+ start:1246 stop:2856 length:1611 start_codon:yes stop_codon:yes gene_type:complete